jgi:uncharacterized protein (TIGR03437 family)
MTRTFLLTFAIAAQLGLGAAVNYSYDAAGRLIGIDYGGGSTIAYAYDNAGNLLTRSVNGVGPSNGGVITSVTTAFTGPSAGISQNAWVQIQGTNLVPATTAAGGVVWSAAPEFAQGKMPTQIGGLSVTINQKPAYVYFFCSAATSPVCKVDQINVLSPLDSTNGNVAVVVTSGGVSTAPFNVAMKPLVPALFNFDGSHVVAGHLNGSIVGPLTLYPGASTPAAPSEQVVVVGTGFGIPPGANIALGSASQFAAFPTLPVCTVGTDSATVAFAGLVGPGLVQLNLVIPPTATTGDKTISCTYGGGTTPQGNVVSIQQ